VPTRPGRRPFARSAVLALPVWVAFAVATFALTRVVDCRLAIGGEFAGLARRRPGLPQTDRVRIVMSLAYRLLYAVGYTPWEQIAELPVVHRRISALFEREEQGREPPHGKALNLGCGSGIWAVELARRGWEVTGVDFIPKALQRARERARRTRVEMRLVKSDVANLQTADAGSGFPFCSRPVAGARALVDHSLPNSCALQLLHDTFMGEWAREKRQQNSRNASLLCVPMRAASCGNWASSNRRWPRRHTRLRRYTR
jgi:SAM-dependent methyltransferase